MSYILDALKKAQAEQNPQHPLRVQAGQQRRHIPPWVFAAAAVLVIGNAYLVYILVTGDDSPAPAATRVVQPTPAVTSPAAPTPPAAAQPATVAPSPAAPVATAPVTQQPVETPAAAPLQQSRSVAQVSFGSLSERERTLYLEMNFTSHIYTDNPEDCAVVIDGRRLSPGDSYKGVVVVEVTEMGAVFEESRNGKRRRVEVPVVERFLL